MVTIGWGAIGHEAAASGPAPRAEHEETSSAALTEESDEDGGPIGPVPAETSFEGGGHETVRRVEVPREPSSLIVSGRYIDAHILRHQPKRSVEDLLRLIPGMLIVQHGNQGKGVQFFVRGFDAVHGSDVEMLVDDIPVNEGSNVHAHGYLDLSFIPPEVVTGIDVHKGSYRIDQGNFATAGSVHYRLGVTEPNRGTNVSYELGSTNRHRVVVVHAPRGRPESTFIALEAMRDDGYGEHRRAERANGLASLRLWQQKGASLDGLVGLYAARFGIPGLLRQDDYNAGRVGFYDAYSDDTKGASSRAIVALRGSIDTEKTHARASFYAQGRRLDLDENFTGDLQDSRYGDRHRQVHDAGTLGVRVHWNHRVHTLVLIQVHGHWQGDLIDQRQDELLEDGTPHDVRRDLRIRQNTWGLAPGVHVAPTPWLTLEGGLRIDLFRDVVDDRLQENRRFRGTFWAVSPRIAARVSLGRSVVVTAAYGRGVRSPEARAVTLPDEAPEGVDLDTYAGGEARMTLTDAVEIGARFSPSHWFSVGTSLFATFIARESIFDHVSGFNIELSGTRRLGIEADVQVHPTDWLELGADVTAVHGRFLSSGTAIPGAPPLIVSMFGDVSHHSGLHAGWRWFLLGPRPLTYGARAGVVTVLDASVGYRHRHFGLDVAIDNILGLKWREGEYNYASSWGLTETRSLIPSIHYIAGYPRMIRATLTLGF